MGEAGAVTMFPTDLTRSLDERAAALGLRTSTPDDAPLVHELMARRAAMFSGNRFSEADIRREMAKPSQLQWILVREDGAAGIALAAVDISGHEHCFVWLTTDDDVDDETGKALVELGVDAARSINSTKAIHGGASENDTTTRKWLSAAGGEEVRRFGRMEIALDPNAIDPPPDPPGVSLRHPQNTDEDWQVLYQVIETAFRDHFGHTETTYEEFVEQDRDWIEDYSLCWIASVDGVPASALLGKQNPGSGYVGVLGTLKEFRGRGLGSYLLKVAFAEFSRRGETLGTLNVDLTNPTGAVAVYEHAGMHLAHTEIAYEFPAGSSTSDSKKR